MKKLIFILALLLVPFEYVHGYFCQNSDISKYKDMAANITTTYD